MNQTPETRRNLEREREREREKEALRLDIADVRPCDNVIYWNDSSV